MNQSINQIWCLFWLCSESWKKTLTFSWSGILFSLALCQPFSTCGCRTTFLRSVFLPDNNGLLRSNPSLTVGNQRWLNGSSSCWPNTPSFMVVRSGGMMGFMDCRVNPWSKDSTILDLSSHRGTWRCSSILRGPKTNMCQGVEDPEEGWLMDQAPGIGT